METLAELWCSIVHDSPMWPIHGRYACRVCGREYPVQWRETATEQRPRQAELRVFEQVVAGSHR
jgi:hypothetical protein